MPLEARTVLKLIEIDSDGRVYMELLKQVFNGDKLLSSEPHRSVVEPTTVLSDQIAAVNADLNRMGFPSMSADLVKQFEAHAKTAHTAEVVSAWKAKVAKEKAERGAAAEKEAELAKAAAMKSK